MLSAFTSVLFLHVHMTAEPSRVTARTVCDLMG